MIRFYIALWASKLYLFGQKLRKREKSDRIGLLAKKICPNFLELVNKPKTVVMVTGTNGKTTVTHLIYDIFKLDGKKVGYNDWNANMISGHIRCLVDCVNIFNKPNKDAAILECDELTTDYSIKAIKPTFVIVTNICRDSIRRNAYPEYIFSKIDKGINESKTSKIILNSDDPISSFLGTENKNRIFISLDNQKIKDVYENISKDFATCPKCCGKIQYDYRHYRHIGRFHCLDCGFKSLNADYIGSKVDLKNKSFYIDDVKYPLLSNNIFNVYNVLQLIVLLKEMGYSDSFIIESLKKVEIPKSRENLEIENEIKIYSRLCKGQNSSAASTVFENLSKDDNLKQLILVMDEVFSSDKAMETITWIYDTDFEFLNKPNIEKIIVTGHICLDYVVRLELAGIPKEKIIVVKDYLQSANYVELKKDSDIYILYEVDQRPTSRLIIEKIKNRIKEGEIK